GVVAESIRGMLWPLGNLSVVWRRLARRTGRIAILRRDWNRLRRRQLLAVASADRWRMVAARGRHVQLAVGALGIGNQLLGAVSPPVVADWNGRDRLAVVRRTRGRAAAKAAAGYRGARARPRGRTASVGVYGARRGDAAGR